jgi:hypothetical protein
MRAYVEKLWPTLEMNDFTIIDSIDFLKSVSPLTDYKAQHLLVWNYDLES